MNSETPASQAEKENPDDSVQLDPVVLDKIKHPPSIHDQMKDLSPEELRGNQAVSPEMLDQPSDEMIGFTRD